MRAETITEKILGRTIGHAVVAGESVKARPDFMIAYDFPGYTDKMFGQMHDDFGITHLEDPERYIVFMDHMLTQQSAKEREIHQVTQDWCDFYGIRAYEAQGIGHQLTVEYGFAQPGRFLIHFDGHISGIGAVNALGWGVRRDLIEGWVSGAVTVTVPETVRINLQGELGDHIDSRDLLHTIIRDQGADGCAHRVIEFGGPGAASLSIDQRQALCGMAMFTGAVSAVFEPDQVVTDYLGHSDDLVYPDRDASYAKVVEMDLGEVVPQVVSPGSAKATNTLPELELRGTRIDRAFIGSCVSGRVDDFRIAAKLLRGRKVAEGVELNVVPSSRTIYRQAEELGYVTVLKEAGAQIAESSCDFCFGYQKPLVKGEKSISTGVLNISGRMGDPEAEIYMGSAATVAESAVRGHITSPLAGGH